MDAATPHQSDRELARAALAREEGGLERLAERLRCVPRMLAHWNRRAGEPVAAQNLPDMVQSCLMVIWRKLPGYRGDASLETWVYRICAWEMMNAARREQRARRSVPQAGSEELHSVAEEWRGQDLFARRDLHESLGRLASEDETVVRLKHYEELTFEEIGRRLGITPSKAKSRYYRSLLELRDALRGGWSESA